MRNLITAKEVALLARPISSGTSETKIETYIKEVEQLYVKPIIGVEMFIDILSREAEELPRPIALLLGGDNSFVGLKVAVAYYAWARIVKNNSVNVTRFGAVVKNDEHSHSIDFKSILKIHDQAIEYADRCMAEVVAFIGEHSGDYPLYAGTKVPQKRKSKTFVIGE